jgi:hypothetical protein
MDEMKHGNQDAADPLDRASVESDSANREAERNRQLAARANNVLPKPKASGLCSDDCGEEVEPARKELGLGRCLACAMDHDKALRRKARGY